MFVFIVIVLFFYGYVDPRALPCRSPSFPPLRSSELMLMRFAKSVVLCAEDDQQLRILSKRKRVEARVQLRARIVLLAASGMSDKDIGRKLDTDRRVAARWRARFLAAGVGDRKSTRLNSSH